MKDKPGRCGASTFGCIAKDNKQHSTMLVSASNQSEAEIYTVRINQGADECVLMDVANELRLLRQSGFKALSTKANSKQRIQRIQLLSWN